MVSLWPVDDDVACLTMVAFYYALLEGKPAPAASNKAQGWLGGLDSDAIRERFKEICAGVGASTTDNPRSYRGEVRRSTTKGSHPALEGPTSGSRALLVVIGSS